MARHSSDNHASIVAEYTHPGSVWNMGRHVWVVARIDTSRRYATAEERERVVNEIEVDTFQEYSKGKIETVSIDSVHLNKNWSLLMAELEMCEGANKIIILYKIDTGSKGNIMPWHIFKRLFKSITEDEFKKTIKGHIKLRTYNKTVIKQLGTCIVPINFKNIKKRCVFFVVPRNGQALLGMPDTAAVKIININIDSIQAAKEECNTNIGDAGESNNTGNTCGGEELHKHRC